MMQQLTAILLCVLLLFTGSVVKDEEQDLVTSTGSYLIRVLEAAAGYGSAAESAYTAGEVTLRAEPSSFYRGVATLPAGTKVEILESRTVLNKLWYQVRSGSDQGWVLGKDLTRLSRNTLPKNQATAKESANLYSSYNQSTRVLAQLEKGARLSILQTAEFSGTQWVYATAQNCNLSGWVLASQLNLPSVIEPAELDASQLSGDYVPSYATIGIVTSSRLNIRTAPGVTFDRVGNYVSGQRVGILETNSGWGRTAHGWISLDYVYIEGLVGQNPMVGNVTADLLNVRSGPGTQYAIRANCRKDDRLLVLEQVFANNAYWGYTRYGWVCMSYIQPDFIPDTTTPLYGYGMVKAEALDVYTAAGGDTTPITQLPKGTIVPVYVTAKVGDTLWGQSTLGWVNMTGLDMRAIFEKGILPDPPVAPPEEPTEPEAPTETEAATAA